MDLHITDTETEKLAAEIAEITGDTKTGAVREALREKKKRLEMRSGRQGPNRDLREFFEKEIWPLLPEEELDQPPMSKKEVEHLLGYEEDL